MLDTAKILQPANDYARRVLDGSELCNKLVKLSVARNKRDLARTKKNDKTWPYYFDEMEASRVIAFISMLRFTAGDYAGQKFMMSDWQSWHVATLFGWRKKGNHKRRFQKSYLEVARKNGKTELAGAILLYGLIADNEYGAQCFSAATTIKQASESFNTSKEMARRLMKDSAKANDLLKVQLHSIFTKTNSFIQALSSEHDKHDGLRPHICVVDEYHAHKNNKMLGVLDTGTGSRSQPVIYIITTAGFNKTYPCYSEERHNVVQVLQGHRFDETLFGMIFTLDEGDDWQDSDVWVKSNPNIGRTPTWDYMHRAMNDARNKGQSQRVHFLTKNLNVWTDASSVWIKAEDWKALALPDIEPQHGIYLGIDLSSVSDITAVATLSEVQNEDYNVYLKIYYYVPEKTARDRQDIDGVPYLRWAEEGHITLTPGNITDYDAVREHINALHEQVNVAHIAIDPWNAWQIAANLQGDGLNIEAYRQGFLSMSEPTKQLERWVMSGKIRHDGNPVTEWMLGNVEIERDAAGNIKPSKAKSPEKIDGISAAVTCIGGYLVKSNKPLSGSYLDEGGELFTL
jgi:phage terminase large subunit-like protein